MAPATTAPRTLGFDVGAYPKLDHKQAGHLRHFYNLVSQPDGEWDHFGTTDAHEEFDDASRYQLATMAYAAGAAHYHRLPALRGAFKSLMHQMITKMLRREVWSYWFIASHGGRLFDPDLKELRKPWADPVVKENIMYSGHLLLMTSLYAMLFDDDEYEREGGITFNWDPLFWGMGSEKFVYNNRSLAQAILKQMEANDWVGVCCEPNAIFVVCNQFPLVALRYNDSRDGTDSMNQEILPKYKDALRRKDMIGKDGLYAGFFALKQGKAIPAKHGAHTAWANAFMNAWNSDFVYANNEKQSLGFLTHFDGKTQIQPSPTGMVFRRLVSEGYSADDKETLNKARKESLELIHNMRLETLNWLSFTMMLSELGKKKELNDLLEYADTHLRPTWEKGGLYYPRNARVIDDDFNLIHVEPHSGNSGIGYSRLNVKDGQKTMWEKPWTREILADRPYVDGDGFDQDIDFLRGEWDAAKNAMIVTLRRWQGKSSPCHLNICNLPTGQWALYIDGQLESVKDVTTDRTVEVECQVGQNEVDVVLQQI